MVQQAINISLTDPGAPVQLYMVQYDSNSRSIAASVWQNGSAFVFPAGASAMLRYKKTDGTCGLYDTDSHGNAVVISGNVVTLPVADQVVTVSGKVFAEVDVFGTDSKRIATFRFTIIVEPTVCEDSQITSSDYFNILTQQIANALAAATNAGNSATLSESWAIGGTGTRTGEDTNNSKYWSEQSALESQNSVKYIPQSLTSAQKQQAKDNIGVIDPTTPPVSSVFGRIGAVTAELGDYTGALVPLTGYVKPASGGAITATDTANIAFGKIEFSIDQINNGGSGAHNSIYRGKLLGTSVTPDQYLSISSGLFTDLYIGDYWTIGGVNYRIAAFDYYYNTGDTVCTTHHVTLVPDNSLYTHVMNDTNVTTGGYYGSKMYTTGLTQAKTTINTAFGSAHILTHRQLLTNAVANGIPTGFAWYDSTVELMNEQNVYGGKRFSPVSNGSTVPYTHSVDKSQYTLFAFRPDLIANRDAFWLRDVVTASIFAYVSGYGHDDNVYASYALGVRPAFSIIG